MHSSTWYIEPKTPEQRAYNYAKTLATTIHKKFYPENTEWKPLSDTLGILTQIDNMVSGLCRVKEVEDGP